MTISNVSFQNVSRENMVEYKYGITEKAAAEMW